MRCFCRRQVWIVIGTLSLCYFGFLVSQLSNVEGNAGLVTATRPDVHHSERLFSKRSALELLAAQKLSASLPEHEVDSDEDNDAPPKEHAIVIPSEPIEDHSTKAPIVAGWRVQKQDIEMPLDRFMAPYEAQGVAAEKCELDFGVRLITEWRSKRADFCVPSNLARYQELVDTRQLGESLGESLVECYSHRQTRHSGPDNLCVAHRVQFNPHLLGDRATTLDRSGYGEGERFLSPARGVLRAHCTKSHHWTDAKFPSWTGKWFTTGFVGETNAELGCDVWIEHPVFVVTRDGELNFYHSSEDFINAFIAFAVLQDQFALPSMQVWVGDRDPMGPYAPVWDAVYSRAATTATATATSGPASGSTSGSTSGGGSGSGATDSVYAVRRLEDLQRIYGAKRVCLRDAIFNIVGAGSPICKDISTTNSCTNSSMLHAYADFMLAALEVPGKCRMGTPVHAHPHTVAHTAPPPSPSPLPSLSPSIAASEEPQGGVSITITLIDRKDYKHRSVSRKLMNGPELAEGLRQAFQAGTGAAGAGAAPTIKSMGEWVRTNPFACNRAHVVSDQPPLPANTPLRFDVQTVDYASVDFRSQLGVSCNSDVLIGAHGAGLTHTLFQPSNFRMTSALIEIFPGSGHGNTHFQNMASYMSHVYEPLASSAAPAPSQLVQKTVVALNRVFCARGYLAPT